MYQCPDSDSEDDFYDYPKRYLRLKREYALKDLLEQSASKRGRGDDHNPSPSYASGSRNSEQLVTYSVGNTHEYPDASEQQTLFTSHKKPTPEINDVYVGVNADDSWFNQVMSVKVDWQGKVFKFNIRWLQKITEIFDFFNKKRKDGQWLYITYDDGQNGNKVLHRNDTPESINYNIAKFIIGGVVAEEYDFASLYTHNRPEKTGFVIRFQSQIRKRPLPVYVAREVKLRKAMLMFAEEVELPINKLVFEFDGDVVLGNVTPKDLEMESGSCIDVKIVNVNQ